MHTHDGMTRSLVCSGANQNFWDRESIDDWFVRLLDPVWLLTGASLVCLIDPAASVGLLLVTCLRAEISKICCAFARGSVWSF